MHIYGDFEINDNGTWKKYKKTEDGFRKTIEASANEPWTSEQIRWYKEAPTYEVIEKEDENKEVSIENIIPNSGTDKKKSVGKLSKDETVTVTATNALNVESGRIKIIKKVDFGDLDKYGQETKENLKKIYANKIKDLSFKFSLDVENYYGVIEGVDSGNPSKYIEVPASIGEWIEETDASGKHLYYVIEKEIDQEFFWVKDKDDEGKGLKYKIVELSQGLTGTNEDGKTVTTSFVDCYEYGEPKDINNANNKTIVGKLKEGDNGTVGEIIDYYINKVDKTNFEPSALTLYKALSNLKAEKDKNNEFKFKVTVTGEAFIYGDKVFCGEVVDGKIQNVTIRLIYNGTTNDVKLEEEATDDDLVVIKLDEGEKFSSKPWLSEDFYWNTIVESPTYLVEEITKGTDYEEEITNGSGRLVDFIKDEDLNSMINGELQEIGNPEEGTEKEIYKKMLEKQLQVFNERRSKRNYSSSNIKPASILITAKNSLEEQHEGKIAIVKRLKGQNYLSDTDIKKLEFKFRIKVENRFERIVTLKYSENPESNNLYKIGDEYVWIYVSDRIMWTKDLEKDNSKEGPKYTIDEIGMNGEWKCYETILPDKPVYYDIAELGSVYGIIFDDVSELSKNEYTIEDTAIEGKIASEIFDIKDVIDFLKFENDSIENKLIDITNLVNYNNKVGPNIITLTKKIEGKAEELEKLREKEYEFRVKITGNFMYDTNTYNGTYYFDTNGDISGNSGATVKIKISDIREIWKSREIKGIDDDPKIEIEEINIPDGIECQNNNQTGTIGTSNSFTFLNTMKAKKAKLKIIKYLDNDAGLTEEEIQKLSFGFKVTVEDQEKYQNKEITIGPGYTGIENGRYYWSYDEIDDIRWYGKDSIRYSIEETDTGVQTEFVSSENDTVTNGGRKLVGELTSDSNEVKEFTSKFTNKSTNKEPDDTGLSIVKIVENFDGNASYDFTVKIKGEFKYNNVEYNTNGSWYSFNGNEIVDNENGVVTISVSGGRSNRWSAGKIDLIEGKDIPEYQVTERVPGGAEYKCTMSNASGTLGGNVTVKATNTYKSKAKIKIIKNVLGISNLTEAEKNALSFKFRIKIGSSEKDVIISRNDGKWVYEEEVETDNLDFEIEEIDTNSDIKFVSASSNIGTVAGKKITGKLKNGSTVNTFTYTNKKDAENESKNGELIIKKDVTRDSLIGKDFYFNIKIKGNFIYDKVQYPNDTDEYLELKYPDNPEATIKGGEIFKLENIEWYGEAPKYEVEEIDTEISETKGNKYWSGTLVNKDSNTVYGNTVIVTNDEENANGGLKIVKTVQGGNISGNEKYTFRVEIEGYEPYIVEASANETIDLGKFSWDKNMVDENENPTTPKYTITEINIPNGSKFESITGTNQISSSGTSVTGRLVQYDDTKNNKNNGIVEVKCINDIGGGGNTGKFQVKKVVTQGSKGGVDLSGKSFTINITISGTFEIGGEKIVNGTKKITQSLRNGQTYTSPTVKWYGDNKPVVHVSEKLNRDGADKGWMLLGISNNDCQLKPRGTQLITVTNEMPEYFVVDLTLELAGDVWEDVGKNEKGKASEPDGIRQAKENLIEGVEVYVYKVYNNGGRRELATIFDNFEGAVIKQPIITDKNGHWDAPRVKISDEGYLRDYTFDIEFRYDGQTYEPTKFLAPTGSAGAYKGGTTASRVAYQHSSMAKDVKSSRETVNNRVSKVKGYSPIDGTGYTTGIAVGSGGEENYLYYKAKNPGTENLRIVSELQTLNSDKTAQDLFKTTARTSVGGLTYGFDKQMIISSVDTELTGQGLKTTIKAKATYNYCLHINLGLVKRPEADVEAQKDLVEATIVVNDKLLTYNFNKLEDKRVGKISRVGENGLDAQNLTYTLGLYKTDYYYRAEMYKASSDYDVIKEFYKTVYPKEGGIDATNMEIYLKYKILLYNGSADTYNAVINSIDDYYESSLELVTEPIFKYRDYRDGRDMDISEERKFVAQGPVYKKDSFISAIKFSSTENNIKGSDGVTYNKLQAQDLGIKLNSGEYGEIIVYMKAKPNTIEEVKAKSKDTDEIINEIRNNQKSNIVEIANYTIKDGNNIAGKVDKDSAPSNIDIINRNDKTWYEEDTDEAPILELGFVENTKTVKGTVWEDNPSSGNYGEYDEGKEALIGGLTTQLVEKVKLQQGNKYVDYDFVWPTNTPLDELGGKTFEELTGFSSTVETARKEVLLNEEGDKLNTGEYMFQNIPSGNYTVRFIYGNNKIALDNTSKNTGDPVALKGTGDSWSENEKILTANYEKLSTGNTPAVYNGQDYQATAYKYGENGLITNEWEMQNWETYIMDGKRLSDARDSESKRLELIANSQTITNANGEILGTANYKNTSHDDLYDMYDMYADTGKLNLLYDNRTKIAGNTEIEIAGKYEGRDSNISRKRYSNRNTVTVEITHDEYNVINLDFGLIQRPRNIVALDKEISEIKVTTNDGNVIFDALYNTEYAIKKKTDLDFNDYKNIKLAKNDDEYLVAKTILDRDNSIGVDVLQALDKIENKLGEEGGNTGTQNFRYINIEDRILQGTTIELKYSIYALNVSEEDYTSAILDEIDIDKDHSKDGKDITAGNTDYRIKTSEEIKAEILKLAKDSYDKNHISEEGQEAIISNSGDKNQIGSYLGLYYYRHKKGTNDKIVTTKVRQIVDYVDNDAVFSTEYNSEQNHSWKSATPTELNGNGVDNNRILRKDILAEFDIVDKNGMKYSTKDYSNIILSIDSQNSTTVTQETNGEQNDSEDSKDTKIGTLNNNDFEKKLQPGIINGDVQELETYSSNMKLTVSKTVSAEDDANNLAYDNLTEIVKFENSVGRRIITAIPGNCNPKELNEENEPIGEFGASLKEIDSSATELITFMPPTGIEIKNVMKTQILIAITAGITIIAVGIVVIKKKILK